MKNEKLITIIDLEISNAKTNATSLQAKNLYESKDYKDLQKKMLLLRQVQALIQNTQIEYTVEFINLKINGFNKSIETRLIAIKNTENNCINETELKKVQSDLKNEIKTIKIHRNIYETILHYENTIK